MLHSAAPRKLDRAEDLIAGEIPYFDRLTMHAPRNQGGTRFASRGRGACWDWKCRAGRATDPRAVLREFGRATCRHSSKRHHAGRWKSVRSPAAVGVRGSGEKLDGVYERASGFAHGTAGISRVRRACIQDLTPKARRDIDRAAITSHGARRFSSRPINGQSHLQAAQRRTSASSYRSRDWGWKVGSGRDGARLGPPAWDLRKVRSPTSATREDFSTISDRQDPGTLRTVLASAWEEMRQSVPSLRAVACDFFFLKAARATGRGPVLGPRTKDRAAQAAARLWKKVDGRRVIHHSKALHRRASSSGRRSSTPRSRPTGRVRRLSGRRRHQQNPTVAKSRERRASRICRQWIFTCCRHPHAGGSCRRFSSVPRPRVGEVRTDEARRRSPGLGQPRLNDRAAAVVRQPRKASKKRGPVKGAQGARHRAGEGRDEGACSGDDLARCIPGMPVQRRNGSIRARDRADVWRPGAGIARCCATPDRDRYPSQDASGGGPRGLERGSAWAAISLDARRGNAAAQEEDDRSSR